MDLSTALLRDTVRSTAKLCTSFALHRICTTKGAFRKSGTLATVWQVANQHSTNRSARPGRRRATHRSSVFWELQGRSASPRSIRSHAHRPFFFEIFAVMGVAPSRQTILRFTGLWLQSTVDSLQPVDMPCLPGEATMQVWLSVVAPRSGPEPKRAQRVPTRATRALREGWQTSLDENFGMGIAPNPWAQPCGSTFWF